MADSLGQVECAGKGGVRIGRGLDPKIRPQASGFPMTSRVAGFKAAHLHL